MKIADNPALDLDQGGVVSRGGAAEVEDGGGCDHRPPPSIRDIALLAVLVTVVRLAYVIGRNAVTLVPDEFSSLGIARFLSGGQYNMLYTNTYRVAPGLLLTPWSLIFDDPATVIRLGFATNAVVAGGTMFVLVPLVHRLTWFGRTGTLFVSGMIAVLPQALVGSGYLWAEPLVTLAFLATLLLLMRHVDEPRRGSSALVILGCALGAASHGRLLPFAFSVAGFVVVHALTRRRFGLAAFSTGLSLLALGGVTLFHRWVVSNVWEAPGTGNSEATVLRRLDKPIEVLDAAAGQAWYQLAASGMIVAFGLVELVRRVLDGRGDRTRRDAWVVLGLTMPIVGLSFVFMSEVGRADHVLYGRYIDGVIWPVLAVGAHWLCFVRPRMSVRRRRFLIAATVVVYVELGLLVHQLHGHQIRTPGVNAMIAGIVPYSDGGSINALVVTGSSLLVAGIVFRVATSSHTDRFIWSMVLVCVVAAAGVRLWVIERPDSQRSAGGPSARAVLDIPDAPAVGSEIGVSVMPNDYGPAVVAHTQLFAALEFQYFLPEYRFVFDNGPSDDVGPYVFAVNNDALLTREGGTILWTHPDFPISLWLEPPRDEFESGSDG